FSGIGDKRSTLNAQRPISNCRSPVAPLSGESRLLACSRRQLADDILFLDSVRVSRAGFGVAPKQSFREVRDDETSSPTRETRTLPAEENRLAACAPQPDHAKKRSGVSIGCGLQMRATQCSQVSCPLRISISTRKKKMGTSVFISKGNRTASFSVVTTISRSRRIHRLIKLCSSASV